MEPSSNKKIAKDANAVVAKPKRRFKITDIIAIIVFALVAFFLVKTITTQLSLKNEVSAAQVVSDRVINDINKTDGQDAYSLGNAAFQKSYTAEQWTENFKQFKQYAKGTPAIDDTIVANNDAGQAVTVIYKYPQQPVFYIGVKVDKVKGSSDWKVDLIRVSAKRTDLIKEK